MLCLSCLLIKNSGSHNDSDRNWADQYNPLQCYSLSFFQPARLVLKARCLPSFCLALVNCVLDVEGEIESILLISS